MEISLFEKYKTIEVKSDGSLFGIDPLIAITHRKCPYCFNKLYKMRNGRLYYCKSKKHIRKFVISSVKIDK